MNEETKAILEKSIFSFISGMNLEPDKDGVDIETTLESGAEEIATIITTAGILMLNTSRAIVNLVNQNECFKKNKKADMQTLKTAVAFAIDTLTSNRDPSVEIQGLALGAQQIQKYEESEDDPDDMSVDIDSPFDR